MERNERFHLDLSEVHASTCISVYTIGGNLGHHRISLELPKRLSLSCRLVLCGLSLDPNSLGLHRAPEVFIHRCLFPETSSFPTENSNGQRSVLLSLSLSRIEGPDTDLKLERFPCLTRLHIDQCRVRSISLPDRSLRSLTIGSSPTAPHLQNTSCPFQTRIPWISRFLDSPSATQLTELRLCRVPLPLFNLDLSNFHSLRHFEVNDSSLDRIVPPTDVSSLLSLCVHGFFRPPWGSNSNLEDIARMWEEASQLQVLKLRYLRSGDVFMDLSKCVRLKELEVTDCHFEKMVVPLSISDLSLCGYGRSLYGKGSSLNDFGGLWFSDCLKRVKIQNIHEPEFSFPTKYLEQVAEHFIENCSFMGMRDGSDD